MTTSDWIQLSILVVVLAYTVVTYLLLRHQKVQFERASRPWVHAGDICYNKRIVLPELGVNLVNTGRIPAQCTVLVDRISVTQPFNDTMDLLNKDEVRGFPVFPYVQRIDSVHMFLFNLTEEQSVLFTKDSKIECHLQVDYQALDARRSDEQYTYEANLLVEHFTESTGKQTTLIKVLAAK
jgi:hypothetical protein